MDNIETQPEITIRKRGRPKSENKQTQHEAWLKYHALHKDEINWKRLNSVKICPSCGNKEIRAHNFSTHTKSEEHKRLLKAYTINTNC